MLMSLSRQRAAYLTILTGISFVVFITLFGLGTIGRDILVIALVRFGLLPALWGYGQAARVVSGGSRLGRMGWLLGVGAAIFNLLGALGWVITDGWWFDPFRTDLQHLPEYNRPEYTYWYAYVIGLSAIAFAVGTLLVGLAGWRQQGVWPAALVMLAGPLYFFFAPTEPTLAHLVWIVLWITLGVLLAFTWTPSAPIGMGVEKPDKDALSLGR